MPQVTVTRRYRFAASHRLNSPMLSAEENDRTYGKCNNPYGHGHDYILEVSAAGELNPAVGRLMPLDALDRLVESVLLKDFAWRNLNVEVAEFATLVPTTENLALVAAERLASAWHVVFPDGAVRFDQVRIYETRNNLFEAHSPQQPSENQNQEVKQSEGRVR